MEYVGLALGACFRLRDAEEDTLATFADGAVKASPPSGDSLLNEDNYGAELPRTCSQEVPASATDNVAKAGMQPGDNLLNMDYSRANLAQVCGQEQLEGLPSKPAAIMPFGDYYREHLLRGPCAGVLATIQSRCSAALTSELRRVHAGVEGALPSEPKCAQKQPPADVAAALPPPVMAEAGAVAGPLRPEAAGLQEVIGPVEPLSVAVTHDAANSENLDQRYLRLEVIGHGTFGTVFKVLDRETNVIMAMKHLHLDAGDLCDGVPAQVIREVSLLRDFDHPNIAQLHSIQINGPGDYDLILEYIDKDLHRVLKEHRKEDEMMPMHKLLKYSHDLLNGIHACHCRLIIHRDLKPQNLLISQEGLKICDFGLARIYSVPIKPYTHDAITLWYRAPEILLGAPLYGPEVDVWSAGCIIAEMATSYPTFAGDSEIGTIFKILKLVGSPTEATWPGYQKLQYWKESFPRWPPTRLEPIWEQRQDLGPAGIDLLNNLLHMNPPGRLSTRRAKNHDFFAPLR